MKWVVLSFVLHPWQLPLETRRSAFLARSHDEVILDFPGVELNVPGLPTTDTTNVGRLVASFNGW